MTLTKSLLLERAKPRIELVRIEAWGDECYFKSISNVEKSRREVLYQNPAEAELYRVHAIIDQVYATETEPMFQESEAEMLASLDWWKLAPLYEALERWNGDDEKKVSGESIDT